MSDVNGPRLAHWTESLERSALEEMLVETARPDVISLALGLPAADHFPTAALARAFAALFESEPRMLQYAPPIEELRGFIAQLMTHRGVECRPEQIFLTAGAQQGMSLITRLLLEPGAPVVVERSCYTGFLQCLAPLEARCLSVSTRPESGIDLDELEGLLTRGEAPCLLYTTADGHNPRGTSMPITSRARLAELARAHRMPILEDDAYGFLSYDEDERPALRAFDPDWVIYLGSFSKTLAPALRTGWLVVPERFIPALSSLKESSDINMATVGQRAVAAFVASGGFDDHVARLRTEYRLRRDALLRALERHFPPEIHWNNPRAGFFSWVELPEAMDASELLVRALRDERVAFLPGAAFAVPGAIPERSALRLNFSASTPDRIEEGVQRLARVLGA